MQNFLLARVFYAPVYVSVSVSVYVYVNVQLKVS